MDLNDKIRILAEAARYDASCASSGAKRERPARGIGHADGMGICHSYTPDGRCVSLLKLLLTNHCSYECAYCVNRASSDVPRAAFTVDEVVTLTLDFYRRNYIEGLFLSSGVVGSPDATMERLTRVARTLREVHGYGGYIHLKAVPGASSEALFEAGSWCDRLSANIELALQSDLDRLAPAKSHAAVEGTMGAIRGHELAAKEEAPSATGKRRYVPAGQSTQLIVGATAASDGAILGTARRLYRAHGLRRVYYSAFSPIPHAAAALPPSAPPLEREHRLYQADWLMRHYGFEVDEVVALDGNLALDRDPKLDWALRHREFFPVDINHAPREALLRIPGCGVRNVERIIAIRRHHAVGLDDLRTLRVAVRRARPFIIAADHHPRAEPESAPLAVALAQPRQLSLFDAVATGISGEF